ncbi:hypothetical protein ACQPXH_15815 [Nocardia sp. CA-135953]|uniref:hypothetical protein n=1 Tax=Nocardia sp. CA-135953 TaxID=3239978 RepID=UPI003D95FC4A
MAVLRRGCGRRRNFTLLTSGDFHGTGESIHERQFLQARSVCAQGGDEMNPQQQTTDKRRQWEAWARRNIDGNESQRQAAVDAAMLAAVRGASSQESAAAGIAAAQAAEAPAAAEFRDPALPGTIVGYARRIQRQQQLSDFGSLQTVEFRLEPLESAPVVVQMRGFLLEGFFADGDVVEVPSTRMRGSFLQADQFYNRSTESLVRMRKGVTGSMAVAETMYGRRLTKAFYTVFFLLFFAIVVFIVGGFIYSTVASPDPSTHNSPSWWCQDAQNGGWDNPPGC